ncbi:MAG: hypothetical protein FWC23_08280 [Chitinispirillia bacterium]|nr:hypothetical protein [Chitinispirillia bacterium]MCL2269167.1 hypothetical protein [Chitinispirillia bacterium]
MAVTPMSVTPQNGLANPGGNAVWNGAGTQFGVGTENVINDMLSGKAMGAYGVQQNAALARAEQNRRANTASQIHSAGFAGTPMGAGAANAAESEMLRNRFDANLGLEVERQNMRMKGAEAAMGYADQVNRFELQQNELRNQQNELQNQQNERFSNSIMINQHWVDAVASGDPMRMNDLFADQDFNRTMQAQWEANGNAGEYDRDWAARQVENIRNQSDAGVQMTRALKSFFPDWSDEDVQGIVQAIISKDLGITKDADGNYQIVPPEGEEEAAIDWSTANPLGSSEADAILTDPRKTGTEEYNAVIDAVVRELVKAADPVQWLNKYSNSPAFTDIGTALTDAGYDILGDSNGKIIGLAKPKPKITKA